MHTVGCSQNFKWANPQCGPALATVFATVKGLILGR
jgi:hypothetical protein